MAGKRSFTEYVANRFDNQFWAVAEEYLNNEYDLERVDFYRIHAPGEPEIMDVCVQHIWVNDQPGMEISFDAAVEVVIEVPDANHHYDESEKHKFWMMVSCRGNLDNRLDDFEIYEVSEYNGKNRRQNPMDDALVPVIDGDNLDRIAEQFLRDHYKKALLEPVDVDPIELAKGMGLEVRYVNITDDQSIFGRMFFYESDTELYDEDTGCMEKVTIPAKTILVDKRVSFLSVVGAVNNTIVHECVHWDKHRKAFALARLYDDELSNIGCKVVGGVAEIMRDSVDWMEWQANALAPRIQMPLEMFKKKAEQIITRIRRETKEYDMIDVIQPVIDELAVTFMVSRLAAKIRMVDAGYDEAAGAFIYLDGGYVKPHKASRGYLEENQTFSISMRDAVAEASFNQELKAVLADGKYIYVDSHFVLNTQLYVETDDFGNKSLTHYARNHMEDCCLAFTLKVKSSVSDRYHTECYLNRDKSSDITFEAHFSKESKNASNQMQMIKDYNADILKVADTFGMKFSDMLDKLIDWSGMTEEELAEAADLSEKTIQRLRNEEPDNVTIETVVQLCIGMKLPLALSNCLIKASGKSFMMTEQHLMYQFLIGSCYYKPLYECNEMLLAQNLKPLGRQNRTS